MSGEQTPIGEREASRNQILSTADVDTKKGEENLEIKMYVQSEVMKVLGFLPQRFDSTASFTDYTKLTLEEADLEVMWSIDIGGVKNSSYAYIFEDEFHKIINNTKERALLELKPIEAINKLAQTIKKRKDESVSS